MGLRRVLERLLVRPTEDIITEWLTQNAAQMPEILGHDLLVIWTSVSFSDKGDRAIKAGQLDEAIDCYTQAIQLQPDLAINYLIRSALMGLKFDLAGMKADHHRAISLDPKLMELDYSEFTKGMALRLNLHRLQDETSEPDADAA